MSKLSHDYQVRVLYGRKWKKAPRNVPSHGGWGVVDREVRRGQQGGREKRKRGRRGWVVSLARGLVVEGECGRVESLGSVGSVECGEEYGEFGELGKC